MVDEIFFLAIDWIRSLQKIKLKIFDIDFATINSNLIYEQGEIDMSESVKKLDALHRAYM